jgi:hypothetical protein
MNQPKPESFVRPAVDRSDLCNLCGICPCVEIRTWVRQAKYLFPQVAQAAAPETLLTDCLSCRMQFNQMLPQPVAHPVEILNAAYRAAKGK